RRIGRIRSFGHHSLVSARQSSLESELQVAARMAEAGLGELKLGASPGFGPRTVARAHHVGKQGFQAAPALAERSIEQQIAVSIEQVKNDVHNRNVGLVDRVAGPQFSLRLRLPAPQPGLEVGERQRAASAPADDFAVENEFSW